MPARDPASLLADAREALEAVLLFHGHGPWDDEKRARWKTLTGDDDATTTVLCVTVRRALSAIAAAPAPEEAEEKRDG